MKMLINMLVRHSARIIVETHTLYIEENYIIKGYHIGSGKRNKKISGDCL